MYVNRGETYELYVSIADVAHYVAHDTALDQEAYARSTSVYFPDRAIPMLPEDLSNGICSLKPHEDRLTKTVCIELNPKGDVIRSRFFNSVIRSHERMTYTDVRRILVDHDPECLARYSALVDEFKRMEELALLLYNAAALAAIWISICRKPRSFSTCRVCRKILFAPNGTLRTA
jgi:ribonuclease R